MNEWRQCPAFILRRYREHSEMLFVAKPTIVDLRRLNVAELYVGTHLAAVL
jgi:hypothetical protein